MPMVHLVTHLVLSYIEEITPLTQQYMFYPNLQAQHHFVPLLCPLQLEPNPNIPGMPTQLTFGGITDALLASFKQSISDLATSG